MACDFHTISMADDKNKLTGKELDAYKEGRQGNKGVIQGTESEEKARERGLEEHENAKQTKKENEEKEKEDK